MYSVGKSGGQEGRSKMSSFIHLASLVLAEGWTPQFFSLRSLIHHHAKPTYGASLGQHPKRVNVEDRISEGQVSVISYADSIVQIKSPAHPRFKGNLIGKNSKVI
jgi:hypothetical protein